MRMGFFLSAAKALVGADADDLAWNSGAPAGSKSMLGFLDSADWTTDAGAGGAILGSGTGNTTRGMISQTRGNASSFNTGWPIVSSEIPAGSFVKLNIKYDGSDLATQAQNVRIGLTLTHGGTSVFYVLGFSHNGVAKNTAEDAFFDASGNVLANKGVFRLVRSNGTSVSTHNGHASPKSMWLNNPPGVFKIGSLSVRYIRITNITFASCEIWFGKMGLYTSASAAAADAGSSSDNWLYAKRAGVSLQVEGGVLGSTALANLSLTDWNPRDGADYVWLKRDTPSRLTIDMGAGNMISESGGLFFRLGCVSMGSQGASRIGIEVSSDGSTYRQRKLSWVASDGSLSTSDANDWYRESSAPEFGAHHPYRYVVMAPAGMMITEP
jgi:hypothetical protein